MAARTLALVGALIQLTSCLPHESSSAPLSSVAGLQGQASASDERASNAKRFRTLESDDDSGCFWTRDEKFLRSQESTLALLRFTQALDSVWLGRVADSCGNWGDCEYVVYQSCGDETFRHLWGPQYAQGVEVKRNNKGELLLVVMGRTAQSGCDVPLRSQFHRKGQGWQLQTAPCWPRESGGVWEVEFCGKLPPICE